MVLANPAQLIRIARLYRFVGVFARGGDRETTAAALAELSQAARAGGLRGDSLKRARQAAALLADEESGEDGVRSLLHLGAECLELGLTEASLSAAEVAHERAAKLPEGARSAWLGWCALLAGIAHALKSEEHIARVKLDDARERLVAADHPDGAALALTQQALLDVGAGRLEGARVCFGFACDFYRAAGQLEASAQVAALAARTWVDVAAIGADVWFAEAIRDADRAGAVMLAAALTVERATSLERTGAIDDAIVIAGEGVRRCAALDHTGHTDARVLGLRARRQLAQLTRDTPDALRHIEAAFELALDLRDAAALGSTMEALVVGLVEQRFAGPGWRLVDRFRERLRAAGFAALAATAEVALSDLRP